MNGKKDAKTEIFQLWENFKTEIKFENRFFFSNEFYSFLCNCFNKKMIKMFPDGTKIVFYRARIGNYLEKSDNELLEAPAKYSGNGRCNPEGISYLYLANNIETAIAEVRAKIGDEVTIAEIEVDLSNIFSFLYYEESYIIKELNIKEDELLLIKIINYEYSRMINSDEKYNYIPLQYISEFVKHVGFDGFLHSSSVSKNGKNLVLFNKNKRKIVDKYVINIIDEKYIYRKNG